MKMIYAVASALSHFVVVIALTLGLSYLYIHLAKEWYNRQVEKTKPIIERNAILEKYNWDGADEEELLRRVMLYSNLSPKEIGKHFSRQELGRVFLENIHYFDKEKRKQWMEYLNIPEEEVERWERK